MDNVFTIPQKKANATGCLVFLHGSGDTGPGLGETVNLLLGNKAQLPHIKIIFPTAPLLPFTAYGGLEVNTWYDISSFKEDATENAEHINISAQMLTKVIDNEVSQGIPSKRIAVAGFSRGGAMSYYMGYSCLKDLAGVGVLSSWLPTTSPLYKTLKESDCSTMPPLFQTHGESDYVIGIKQAKNTVSFFESVGIKTKFNTYPYVGHEVKPNILEHLYSFIASVIPDDM